MFETAYGRVALAGQRSAALGRGIADHPYGIPAPRRSPEPLEQCADPGMPGPRDDAGDEGQSDLLPLFTHGRAGALLGVGAPDSSAPVSEPVSAPVSEPVSEPVDAARPGRGPCPTPRPRPTPYPRATPTPTPTPNPPPNPPPNPTPSARPTPSPRATPPSPVSVPTRPGPRWRVTLRTETAPRPRRSWLARRRLTWSPPGPARGPKAHGGRGGQLTALIAAVILPVGVSAIVVALDREPVTVRSVPVGADVAAALPIQLPPAPVAPLHTAGLPGAPASASNPVIVESPERRPVADQPGLGKRTGVPSPTPTRHDSPVPGSGSGAGDTSDRAERSGRGVGDASDRAEHGERADRSEDLRPGRSPEGARSGLLGGLTDTLDLGGL